MAPFEPRGEQARWRVLYTALRGKEVGQTLTYEEMGELLDLSPTRDRHVMQMAMRRAQDEYLEKDLKALEAVRGVGYEVVAPRDHLRLATKHGDKAARQLTQAASLATHVDFNGMDDEVRKGFETVARGFGEQQEINRRQARKNADFAEALATASTTTERTQGEVDVLRQRMARLEAKLSGTAQEPTESDYGTVVTV